MRIIITGITMVPSTLSSDFVSNGQLGIFKMSDENSFHLLKLFNIIGSRVFCNQFEHIFNFSFEFHLRER